MMRNTLPPLASNDLLSRDLRFRCGTELKRNQLGELSSDVCHRIFRSTQAGS